MQFGTHMHRLKGSSTQLYLLRLPLIRKSDISSLGIGALCEDVNDGLLIHAYI